MNKSNDASGCVSLLEWETVVTADVSADCRLTPRDVTWNYGTNDGDTWSYFPILSKAFYPGRIKIKERRSK